MSIKLKNCHIDNPIIVAPMAGVSDVSFRMMLRQFNPGLIYTEMVSDKAIVYRNERTLKMMEIPEIDHPIALQLFGHDLDTMVEAAQYIDETSSCDILDINMGCPVLKVVKNEAGSALLKDPDYIYTLMKSIVDAVKKPVSAKIRLGWDKESVNAVEVAKALEQAGVSMIAVHGRTRSQMYQGTVDIEGIAKVKKAVSIPVIANGDINSLDSAKRMFESTQSDGIMIGRATLKNPWLIKELVDDYYGTSDNQVITMDDKLEWLDHHCRLSIDNMGEEFAMRHMRSQALWLVSGLPMSAELKRFFSEMKTYEEFARIVDEYKERVRNYES